MKRLQALFFVCITLAVGNAQAKTIEMKVNGLVCAFCAQGIEKTMKSFTETELVLVNLAHQLVAVELKADADISDARLSAAITEAGYSLVSITRTENSVSDLSARIAAAEQADE